MALIYVVEDDKNIQEIETFALANVGYEVKGFDSATDFYEALNDTTPDLILLDIMLPDEDGLSIVKKLRTRQDTVLVPVIMVTAKTTEIDKVKGLDLGADDYITKPFGVMELISRVKAMLRRSQKSQEKDKVLKLGNIVLDREKHSVAVGKEPVELTYKEYELLKLLMTNAGIVTTRDARITAVSVWQSHKAHQHAYSRALQGHWKAPVFSLLRLTWPQGPGKDGWKAPCCHVSCFSVPQVPCQV